MTRRHRGRIAAGLALTLLLGLGMSAPVPASAARVEAFFGKDTLPYAWVTGVFRDGDDVWVGTKNGTRIYSLAKRTWRMPPDAIAGMIVTGVARFGDSLFVATEKALNIEGPKGWEAKARIENAAAENGDLAVCGDALWMAARTMVGGLLRYDGASWKLLSRGQGTGVMNNVTRLACWNGELWAGTVNNGIYRWKSGNWNVLGPEDGLPSLWVTSIAGSGEGIYAGTPDGLGYFDGSRWRVFREKDGSPSNKISSLKVMNDKVIVGTFDRGISVFDGRRFESFGQAEGLSDNRVESIEVVDDTVWVGTVNGLNILRIS